VSWLGGALNLMFNHTNFKIVFASDEWGAHELANALVRHLMMQKCLMMGMSIQKVLTFSSQEKVSHPRMHLVFHN